MAKNTSDTVLTPAHDVLIRAMVRKMVDDYLRPEASNDKASEATRPNPVPLPNLKQAA
jgi:hypothetical protein